MTKINLKRELWPIEISLWEREFQLLYRSLLVKPLRKNRWKLKIPIQSYSVSKSILKTQCHLLTGIKWHLSFWKLKLSHGFRFFQLVKSQVNHISLILFMFYQILKLICIHLLVLWLPAERNISTKLAKKIKNLVLLLTWILLSQQLKKRMPQILV